MQATELFENAMDWLREHYDEHTFFLERDIVWTVQTHILQEIEANGLPYRIVHEYKVDGRPADLAILSEDAIEVVMEFKYEPHRSRSTPGKFPVTVWRDNVKDVEKSIERVEQGKANAAYSAFIDEGGYFPQRHPAPRGAEWRDWGEGRWVLWSRVGASGSA